ncbi:MAG: multidrug efflux MFS transporter Bcr, partial [Escherichia coli]|nr:multidrug efflux MFS transporter Bcr [Escherichia coli]
LVTTIAPLMAPIVGGWVLVWLSWHYIFWILAVAAILASAMIFFLIKETLPPERRQPFHIRTTIGNFAALFRHKRVLSYMLASGFSFAGMFSFLSAGPFVYIEINHVAPENFGYYFALNILFLFVMTIFNSRFVRRIGALNMFRSGLWIQFIMAAWMVISALLGLGFWSLVVGVAAFVGCVSMVSSNAMAVILDEFPHMAGTASSLAGTFRFGIGAIVGALLSLATFNSAWPMIWSIAFCATSSILFCLYASRPKKR